MSSEILNNEHDSGTASLNAARHEQFCSDIADGLHALAQPLSVLRSAIELLACPGTASLNRQRYIDLSVEHIQRTCRLFGSLQDLLATEIGEPVMASVDLEALVTPLVEERTLALRPLGIDIAASYPDRLERACGDPARIEQAITAALDIAASVAESCDVLETTLTSSEGFVEFAIRNRRRDGRALSAANRLSLSLARASMLSQQGRCTITEDAFCVAFALPVSDDELKHFAA